MMDWFRWYNETIEDKKWRAIGRKTDVPVATVVAVWCAVCENANQSSERGKLEGWSSEDAAAALDLDTEQVDAIIAAMRGKVLDDDDRLTGWEKRNPKREDPRATERKRRQRSRNVTPPSRNVPPVTPLEVDRELEGETDTSSTIIELRGRVDEDAASRVMRAANAGMKANPSLPDFKPIRGSHPSRQTVMDWLADGIPADFAATEVEGRARDYKPAIYGDQISSMKYFDRAVRDAWTIDRTEVSDGADDRATGKAARGAPNKYDAVTEDGSATDSDPPVRLRAS